MVVDSLVVVLVVVLVIGRLGEVKVVVVEVLGVVDNGQYGTVRSSGGGGTRLLRGQGDFYP